MMAYHKPNVTGYLFIPYNITGPTRVNWSPGIVRRPESSHRVRPLGCTAIGWPHGLSLKIQICPRKGWDPYPWEPTTLIFRGYKPYFYGLKPSFFVVLGSHGYSYDLGIFRPSILFDPGSGFLGWSKCERPAGFPVPNGRNLKVSACNINHINHPIWAVQSYLQLLPQSRSAFWKKTLLAALAHSSLMIFKPEVSLGYTYLYEIINI